MLKEASEIINAPLLPLWRRTFFLPDNQKFVLSHFSLFDNAFQAQTNFDNLTYEFLHQMKMDTLNMIREGFKYQYFRKKMIPAENEKFDDDCFAIINELTLP